MMDINQKLLREVQNQRERANNLQCLVKTLMIEIKLCYEAQDRLQNQYMFSSELRRIAALHKIPQEKVFEEFNEWLRTKSL